MVIRNRARLFSYNDEQFLLNRRGFKILWEHEVTGGPSFSFDTKDINNFVASNSLYLTPTDFFQNMDLLNDKIYTKPKYDKWEYDVELVSEDTNITAAYEYINELHSFMGYNADMPYSRRLYLDYDLPTYPLFRYVVLGEQPKIKVGKDRIHLYLKFISIDKSKYIDKLHDNNITWGDNIVQFQNEITFDVKTRVRDWITNTFSHTNKKISFKSPIYGDALYPIIILKTLNNTYLNDYRISIGGNVIDTSKYSRISIGGNPDCLAIDLKRGTIGKIYMKDSDVAVNNSSRYDFSFRYYSFLDYLGLKFEPVHRNDTITVESISNSMEQLLIRFVFRDRLR